MLDRQIQNKEKGMHHGQTNKRRKELENKMLVLRVSNDHSQHIETTSKNVNDMVGEDEKNQKENLEVKLRKRLNEPITKVRQNCQSDCNHNKRKKNETYRQRKIIIQ